MTDLTGRPTIRLAYVTTLPQTQWAFLRGQNRYMAATGFELHAIASPGAHLTRLAERDAVVPHAIPMSRSISPLRDCVSLGRLFLALRRIQPDIVHVSTPKAALLGALAAWAARVPVRICFARGSITEPATGLKRVLFRALERLTAALCHQTICVAPSLLAFFRTEGILPPAAGIVLANGMSNGIDVDRFTPDGAGSPAAALLPRGLAAAAPDRDGAIVGYVGRLARDKGLEELAQAWQCIRTEFPRTHLLLVGAWEDQAPVAAEWRAALERDPRVHFTGRVDDVVPYYRLMSLFVFPSHGTEGFPNVPMEAAAMGLPVIATRVVGSVDAVQDGVTGALIPPRDVVALTDVMRRYLSDAAARRRHGDAGRSRVLRDFRQEPIWRALHAEYLRLVRAHGLAARVPAAGTVAPASRAS